MNALILAAGYGSRLLPFTELLPKCLMPVNGSPILHHWICRLISLDINKIVVNTCYKSDLVSRFIEAQFYRENVIVVHEDELLGTAGTLFKNKDFFEGEDVLVIHCDNFTDINLKELTSFHLEFQKEIQFTLSTFESRNPNECGIVTVKDGILQSFIEKPTDPASNLANCAIYLLGKDFFKIMQLHENIKDISTDLIPQYPASIKCYNHNGYNIDIGTIKSFLHAQHQGISEDQRVFYDSILQRKYAELIDLVKEETGEAICLNEF